MSLDKPDLTREQRFWIDRMRTSEAALDEIPVTMARFISDVQSQGLLEETRPRIVRLNDQGKRYFSE